MARKVEPLDDRHYEAIRLLASVPRLNHEQIARKLRISRMTLYRWRQRPDFARALNRTINDEVKRRFNVHHRRVTEYNADEIESILRITGLLT